MMLTRIIPFALVAAIVTCPLLCRDGRCQGCCANKQIQTPCAAEGTADCCCPTTSHDGENQRPCDNDPSKSGCQGVCGGAVLEKPNNLPEPTVARFLNHFKPTPTLAATLLNDRQSHTVESRLDCSMTPGRYLRTLYMSFLC